MKRGGGVITACRPSSLDGSAEGRPLAGGEADGRHAEDIGAELPPEVALGATASDADLGRVDAQSSESIQSVGESQGDAFHRGSGEVGWGKVFGGDAVKDAAPAREIRGSLSGEVRE